MVRLTVQPLTEVVAATRDLDPLASTDRAISVARP
jgi:hypothetical protein